jgi:hypothetical protein
MPARPRALTTPASVLTPAPSDHGTLHERYHASLDYRSSHAACSRPP